MYSIKSWQKILFAGLLSTVQAGPSQSQMNMNPYFSAIHYPLEKYSMMLMVLPDYQVARYGNNFFTGMFMAQYGIMPWWTVGAMAEGQKIAGLPATYGGLRFNTYFHLIPADHMVNVTLYAEYEELNGAALYKMEVAGFGPEDLTEPLALARKTAVRTLEQRLILYHDWERLNATFNFIRETALKAPYGSDYGYALGLFYQPAWMSRPMSGMAGMTGMTGMDAPPVFSISRLGYGLEMIGALGDEQRFGFSWNEQQHYLGAVLTYALTLNWSVRLAPIFGLSEVSDPFVLRMGVAYMFSIFSPR
jgi:hypothetical protein